MKETEQIVDEYITVNVAEHQDSASSTNNAWSTDTVTENQDSDLSSPLFSVPKLHLLVCIRSQRLWYSSLFSLFPHFLHSSFCGPHVIPHI